jgi:hypothetical protein
MATISEIPTHSGRPFSEKVSWNDVNYLLSFAWNTVNVCWVLDIFDADTGIPILTGIPLVTGCDILEQFGYLPVAASAAMTVMSLGPTVSPDAVPDFNSLGVDGHLYLLTP